MSTYNGQKYIKEQLESLLVQIGINVRIIIRDDGSSDDTVKILKEYANAHSNIIIIEGENRGTIESFNLLCRYALQNESAEYYAFCDQDDVWDSDKLQVAICKLREFDNNKPSLYFSNLRMVDSKLNYIRDLFSPGDVLTERSKTLVQTSNYGCTCVFNRAALTCYCKPLQQISLHDRWLYCVCSYLGNVYYDQKGHIQYRQHENNASGAHLKGFTLLLLRIRRLLKGNYGHEFENVALQLLLFQKELTMADLKRIKQVANYRNEVMSKITLFFSSSYKTGNLMKDVCIRYRILFNSL